MLSRTLVALAALASPAFTFDQTFAWNSTAIVETRSMDEIHQAALKEGGVVTLWHGGGSKDQEAPLKKAFEKRFPGMTLNVTVKNSPYLVSDIDRQLAVGGPYVDNAMLQTTQVYPDWRDQGVLLNYKPNGFDQVYDAFKDIDGAWAGYTVNGWSIIYNKEKLGKTSPPETFLDFLKPDFKDKLIFRYPNEDDAILHTFDLIMKQQGLDFFDRLQLQNPTWTAHAPLITAEIQDPNSTAVATFTTTIGLLSQDPLEVVWPTRGAPYVTWAQPAAIFKDAPHPESAKLLHNYVISAEWQKQAGSWSTRRDIKSPGSFPSIFETPNTNPLTFVAFMADRARVERLRFWFEDKLGFPR